MFGFIVFQERDFSDKIDDGSFLLVGLAILGWYLWPGHAYRRSPVPILMACLDVVVQIAGLVLERDDPKAFGDNIGGIVYFGAALLFLIAQRIRTPVVVRRMSKAHEVKGQLRQQC